MSKLFMNLLIKIIFLGFLPNSVWAVKWPSVTSAKLYSLCQQILAQNKEDIIVKVTGLRKFRSQNFRDALGKPIEFKLTSSNKLIRGFVGFWISNYVIRIEEEDGNVLEISLADIDRSSVKFFNPKRRSFSVKEKLVLDKTISIFEGSQQIKFNFEEIDGTVKLAIGQITGYSTDVEGYYRIGISNTSGQVQWIRLSNVLNDSILHLQLSQTPININENLRADLATNVGINSLIKVADLENMIDTFKAGAFLPGEHQRWHDGVYLEARGRQHIGNIHTPYNTPDQNKSVVIYVMNTRPLNRDDFYAHVGWQVGNDVSTIGEEAIKATELDRLTSFLEDVSSGKRGYVNEFVFKKPVSLKDLKLILVQPGQKERIIKILQSAGIEPPNGVQWVSLISEQETWPEI